MAKNTVGPFTPMQPLSKEVWDAQVQWIMNLKRNKMPLMLSGKMYDYFKKLPQEKKDELLAMYNDLTG